MSLKYTYIRVIMSSDDPVRQVMAEYSPTAFRHKLVPQICISARDLAQTKMLITHWILQIPRPNFACYCVISQKTCKHCEIKIIDILKNFEEFICIFMSILPILHNFRNNFAKLYPKFLLCILTIEIHNSLHIIIHKLTYRSYL